MAALFGGWLGKKQAAPVEPVKVDFSPESLDGAWPEVEGFVRPEWKAISEYIRSKYSESELDAAFTAAARCWLEKIRAGLGGLYHVAESECFLLLSAQRPRAAKATLLYCENAQKSILQELDGVAAYEGRGKRVVMLFKDRDPFYKYVVRFYPPETKMSLMGGIFVPFGYRHFVLFEGENAAYCLQTMVHELTHACLSHLPLPLWLNEGVTKTMDRAMAGSSKFLLRPEDIERQLAFWNENRIQHFWSGRSFHKPDPYSKLSYQLAETLVGLLLQETKSSLKPFLLAANRKDAGEAAALEHLGGGVGDLAAMFLGDGYWAPQLDEQGVLVVREDDTESDLVDLESEQDAGAEGEESEFADATDDEEELETDKVE